MLPANAASVVDSADARQLPVLIAEWLAAPADDARHWIARALRVDLALLTDLSQIALTSLERRCAQDPAWFEQPPVATPAMLRAAELTREWAAESGRRLKSVRPPPVPLGGGVLEEYRTSARGELCVSSDGAQVGIVGGDDAPVSWDRASGRRTDGAASAAVSGSWAPLLPAVVDGPAWAIGRDNTWQHLALASSGGEQLVIDLGVDLVGRAVRNLNERLVIVDCDDFEGDARYCLVDVRSRTILWTVDGDCTTAQLDGDVAICGGRRGVAIRDLSTGDARGGWSCPAVETVLCVPKSRDIITRSGAVIRVWARDARGAELAGTYGWTTAMFSPDGTRLVTGGNLCDAHTGAHIARMRVNGPGWIEGGPPNPCQALVDGAFVEIQPMGLQIWSSADGRLILEDREQPARFGDQVTFDPRGRYYAISQHKTGKLAVRRLGDGETVLTRIVPLATRDPIGFTADGEELWWLAADGTRWIQRIGSTSARLLDKALPALPAGSVETVRDGLLAVSELAIACDEAELVASPDDRAFAGRRTHIVIAG